MQVKLQQIRDRLSTQKTLSIQEILDYLNFHHSDVQIWIKKSDIPRISEKNVKNYLGRILASTYD